MKLQHQLEKVKNPHGAIEWRCVVCHLTWVKKPHTECAGIPVFRGKYPDHLLSKSQIEQRGLKLPKNAQPIALACSRRSSYLLYDIAIAIPKRSVSDKQRAALASARQKAACRSCGRRGAKLRDGYCFDCAEERRLRQMFKSDRRQAIDWSRTAITDPTAVIIDTETTGLNTEQAEIVQVAIVEANTGRILLNSYIKPDHPIDEQIGYVTDVERPWRDDPRPINAYTVHRIGNQQVACAPSFKEIYPRLVEALRHRRVFVYNVAYDAALLKSLCKRNNLPTHPLHFQEWECAMLVYAEFFGDWNRKYRSYTWQPLGGNHDALGDALTCRQLILNMACCDLGVPNPLFSLWCE